MACSAYQTHYIIFLTHTSKYTFECSILTETFRSFVRLVLTWVEKFSSSLTSFLGSYQIKRRKCGSQDGDIHVHK